MALFEADEQTDPARGVALAERAQQVRPDNVFVDDAMAWALFRAGDTAIEHLELALRDPWFSFRHRDRALDLADELGVVRSTP